MAHLRSRVRLAVCVAWIGGSSGCYLAHERASVTMDAGHGDAGHGDAGAPCVFSVTLAGRRADCTIDVGSREGCAEAALCLCDARGDAGSPTELLACAGWDLVPRGALTFTDFCTAEPPERMSMSGALRSYLGVESATSPVTISAGCDAVPALIGTRPYGDCGAIATQLCECVPGCDLDAALGRECLAMPPEHVHCIVSRMYAAMTGCAFFGELPALATSCD